MPLRERPRARHPPRPSFVRSASREIRYAQERACVPLPTAPGFGAPTRRASENLRGGPALRRDVTLRAARKQAGTGSKRIAMRCWRQSLYRSPELLVLWAVLCWMGDPPASLAEPLSGNDPKANAE